jgi:hypothetical protein
MKAIQVDVVDRATELLTSFSLSTAAPELGQRIERRLSSSAVVGSRSSGDGS